VLSELAGREEEVVEISCENAGVLSLTLSGSEFQLVGPAGVGESSSPVRCEVDTEVVQLTLTS